MTQWRPRSIIIITISTPSAAADAFALFTYCPFRRTSKESRNVVWETEKKTPSEIPVCPPPPTAPDTKKHAMGRHSIEPFIKPFRASLTQPCEGNQRRRGANDVAETCFCYCCATTVLSYYYTLHFVSICVSHKDSQADGKPYVRSEDFDLYRLIKVASKTKTTNTNRIQFPYRPSVWRRG